MEMINFTLHLLYPGIIYFPISFLSLSSSPEESTASVMPFSGGANKALNVFLSLFLSVT
jgi:hypothetical protein